MQNEKSKPNKAVSKTKAGKHYISFGGGTRLVAEEIYANAMGLSTVAFRSLCKALSVPRLQIGGYWMVDRISMELAFRWLGRIGQPDFLAPGCAEIAKHGRKSPRTKKCAVELNVEEFHKNIKTVIAELLYSKHLLGLYSEGALVEQAEKAADRMLLAALQHSPTKEAEDYAAHSLRHVQRLENKMDEQARSSNV